MEYVLVTFLVNHILQVKDKDELRIVGDDVELGVWDVSRGVPLVNLPLGSPQWVGVARVPAGRKAFKAVVASKDNVSCWEEVPNRKVALEDSIEQALVKFTFGDAQEDIELKKEPEPTLAAPEVGKVRVFLPYWRHSLTSTFVFVDEKMDHENSHECVYSPTEGAAIVDLNIPEDLKLVGHFEVVCGSDVRKSCQRVISLPAKTVAYSITWPFSDLEHHEITESIPPGTKEIIEPVDEVSEQVTPPVKLATSAAEEQKGQKHKKKRGLRRLLYRIQKIFRK